MTLEHRLEWFFERKLIMFFLWKEHYLNPLIPEELTKLKSSGLLDDKCVRQVMDEFLPEFEAKLPSGMYFPVPISRTIKQGKAFTTELAIKFHYNFIQVDENQKWSLRNKNISGKVLSLFESNLSFEKKTGLYFIEYMSDNRWDKCYLECAITPMLALAIDNVQKELKLQLNNQHTDSIDLNSFRIDSRERCFVHSQNHGEVLLAETPRFWLLDHLNESGSQLVFGKNLFPFSNSA